MTEFDQVFSRKNTNSEKWDGIAKTYGKDDLLPLWVADMDFKAPIPVTNALREYVDAGIYGYSQQPESLYNAIIDWQRTRHHFSLAKKDILFNSGVVASLALAVQAYTQPGDSVLIHNPVYPPFSSVIQENNRKLISSKLLEVNHHFEMDLAEMEQLIITHKVKLFILCNPHNPGGRVWSKEELKAVGELCQKHDIIVVSDEIHQDLVFTPHVFTSFQTVDPAFADFSIILTSVTKTFNLAGLKNSMVFIKNPELRKQFSAVQNQNKQSEINTLGLIGAEAAYRYGQEWLEELLVYLEKNITYTYDYLQKNLPKVTFQKTEGTYLIWLDFSAYQLSDNELQKKMIEEAKVVLNSGITFGSAGTQRMRLNVACPKATLQEGLERITRAFS